jgi:hypothetical protein
MVLIIIAIIAVALAATLSPLLFLKLRHGTQDDVIYERGMEMVPVLIHMPPASEDTEAKGRDVRDVVDENISKAQIIYNIISSTTQKNFKNRWYGQRHFSFEIVGVKGFVYLYAAVPADMLDVLKQAVTSAYPAARLEIVVEHNIFNEAGGINGVTGGEFNLKEDFAYPIATYQDLKRDALQSILNALSSLDASDGAAIQILFRPVEGGWRKQATTHASKKRKGTDKSATASALAKEMVTALVKPPESKEGGGAPAKKELSSLEQSVVDAIDDKTRYAGFDVTIRTVASSNISQRSQAIINSIVASFSLFDAPGRNGFKYEPAKDTVKLTTDYLLRAFPRRTKRNIMNTVELATLFHFPDQSNVPTSQLSRQESKQVDGPRNMPDEGLLLGFNVFRGVKKPIRLPLKDRQRHMYAVGQTGTGKSTFLENLALQDMLSGNGFAFVDPHGDTAEKLLSMVPKERAEDVIYFNPGDMEYPMGLNLFEFQNPDQKDFLIQEAIGMLYKLYDPQHQGIIGPRYEHLFRNAALTIMADPAGGTFVDIPKLFRDPQFVKQKLQHVTDQNVREFWEKEMPQSQRSNEFGEIVSWFVSKFGAFLSNEMMRNIIGQTKSAFDLRDIMDNKKILLVNLSKGRLGDLNSKLLGMMFVMKFQAAAMSRSDVPEDQRQDFALYVDEFQNFSTDSFATILSEARKYHLNLIVANQFTTQLTEEIRDAVFGNVGTIVSFRVGQNDVESLGRYFQPMFDVEDLLRVPSYNAIVRTLINGVPTQPFSMATLPPLGNPNPALAGALKQLSAAKYGKPKAVIEKAIFDRLATVVPEPKPFQSPFGANATAPSSGPQPLSGGAGHAASRMNATQPAKPASSGTGSFLDEWLAKQRAQTPAPVLSPARQSLPVQQPKVIENVPANPVKSDVVQTTTSADPVNDQSASTGNISSAQLDQQEIDDIASELKKGLKQSPGPVPELPDASATKPVFRPMPLAPAPEPEPMPEPASQEGVLKLNNRSPNNVQNITPTPDDTIFIDNEGQLRINAPDA